MYPEPFLNMMKSLLGEEYSTWLKETENEPKRGFRINPMRIDPDAFFRISSLERVPSPFAENAYYNTTMHGLGNLPEYRTGAVYPQEPSASSAVAAVDIQPGMRILDLCAAPGSKATQIAERLHNEGLLIANDIHHRRSLVLAENLERCGSTCTVVTNNDPVDLAASFPGYFDIVFCDAPCSGEGMFRKDDEALAQWSMDNVLMCAARQRTILDSAVACLRPGGLLVYSTCTLNTMENEENIVWLCRKYPEMETVPLSHTHTRPGFAIGKGTEHAQRIFPMDGGEGHFVCVLRKAGTGERCDVPFRKTYRLPAEAAAFLSDHFERDFPYIYCSKDTYYGSTAAMPETGSCRIIRPFVRLGQLKNKRFEPDHALAMNAYSIPLCTVEFDDQAALDYLKGLTRPTDLPKGWYVCRWNRMPLGWTYSDGRILKNKYPKAYRIRG
ncbi:MAG: NOL1/NOP2/sun family putative RNA methylase [Erysipelotrichaceae bacterium]|nr:NOL1/NOP2/sun family putative RNA methylase [Erysipelotrichaceae bacterium]